MSISIQQSPNAAGGGVAAGTAVLVGTDKDRIVRETLKLLNSRTEYDRISKAVNPYGDGRASERIARRFKETVKRNCTLGNKRKQDVAKHVKYTLKSKVNTHRADVVELADAPDSKSGGGNLVRVRFSPSAPYLIQSTGKNR